MTELIHNYKIVGLDQHRINKSDCLRCTRKGQCPAFESLSSDFQNSGNRAKPVLNISTKKKELTIRAGDEFRGIYMVRSGFFKSYIINIQGQIRITGFILPGEVFGLNGIDGRRYASNIESLGKGSLCRIPLSVLTYSLRQMAGSAMNQNVLFPSVLELLSRAISRDQNLIAILGSMSAARRFASFLSDIASRMRRSGFREEELILGISRDDIANFLGMAVGTVSRISSCFQALDILKVEGRRMTIRNMEALNSIATHEKNQDCSHYRVNDTWTGVE